MPFTLKCYRDLKQNLGFYDSVIELNELAIRNFSKQVQNSNNKSEFIEKESKEFGIRVNFDALPEELKIKMAQSYIITVYQSAEVFLYEFKRKHNQIISKNNKWDFESKKSKLLTTLKKVDSSYDYSDSLLVALFEYYRFVRNCIVHKDANMIKRSKDELDNLKKFSDQFSQFKIDFNIDNAPNDINNICFDDFILFTKVTKELGFLLCQLTFNSLTNKMDLIEKKKFRKLLNNSKKLEKAVRSDLKSNYGLSNDEAINALFGIDLVKSIGYTKDASFN